MDLPDVIAHCLSKPGAEETTPFGPDVLVYKVAGKMFALTSPDDFPSTVNLKCDPERSIELRDEYPAITPGYHMNKKHWVSIDLPSAGAPLDELIRDSYELVVATLPRDRRPK